MNRKQPKPRQNPARRSFQVFGILTIVIGLAMYTQNLHDGAGVFLMMGVMTFLGSFMFSTDPDDPNTIDP